MEKAMAERAEEFEVFVKESLVKNTVGA